MSDPLYVSEKEGYNCAMTETYDDDFLIKDLPLPTSPRMNTMIKNALINDSIFTVGDLKKRSEAELLRIPNLGRNGVQIIHAMVGIPTRLAFDERKAQLALAKEAKERAELARLKAKYEG